ncbi:MAG: hypothetical protein V3V08_05575 [Nannocystaceae bacterium]
MKSARAILIAISSLALGCTSAVSPLALSTDPPARAVVLESTDDDGFTFSDGCNTFTCNAAGGCVSTVVYCNVISDWEAK